MKEIQQLIKKENQTGNYQDIFPKTFLDAVVNRETGVSLDEILTGFNMYFLTYLGGSGVTRLQIPDELRRQGLFITYVLFDKTTVIEWYDSDDISDEAWQSDANWRKGSNMLVGDISISSEGNWIVKGVDTGVKAAGDRDITPVLRIYNNKLQVSYNEEGSYVDINDTPVYTQFRVNNNHLEQSVDLGQTWTVVSDSIAAYFRNEGNKIQISRDQSSWTDISDYVAAWFKWVVTGNNLGKIQISRDNQQTWQDLSSEFVNNLYIKGYVATVNDLPSSATQGDIYGVGPTYDPSDTNHINPIYTLHVCSDGIWVNSGRFTSISAGVVQTLGQSETEVISQKVVSDHFIPLEEPGVYKPHTTGTTNRGQYKTYIGTTINAPTTSNYEIDCSAGFALRISLRAVGDTSGATILYVDSKGAVVKYEMRGIGTTKDYINVYSIAPANTAKVYISYMNSLTPIIEYRDSPITDTWLADTYTKRVDFNKCNATVTTMKEAQNQWVKFSDYALVTGKYCTKYNTILDSTSWNYILVDLKTVTSNTKYDFYLGNNINVAGFLYRDDADVMVGYEMVNVTGATYHVNNYVPTIPEGATKMYITFLASSGIKAFIGDFVPISWEDITTSYPINVTISDGNAEIKSSYGDGLILNLSLLRNLNNLPDLRGINVYNSNNVLQRTLLTPSTDFFTAYIIEAINNPDGDPGRVDFNTGGNHLFGTTTGTPTGRNLSIKFIVDGKLVSSGYTGGCNNVQINIVNRIQAYNTVKADGSGREVLQDEIYLTLYMQKGKLKMDIIRKAIPLEPIKVGRMFLNSIMINRYPNFSFLSDNVNRNTYDANTSPNIYCGQGNNGVVAYTNTKDYLRSFIDRSIGYASAKDGTNLSYFDSLKYYNAILYPGDTGVTAFNAGDIIRGEGYIEFWYNL